MLELLIQFSAEALALVYRWGGVAALLLAILLIVWFNVPTCAGELP